jgi:hypothetical protein
MLIESFIGCEESYSGLFLLLPWLINEVIYAALHKQIATRLLVL